MWVTSLGLAGEAGIFASLPFYPMFSGIPNGPLRLSPPQVHAAVHNSGVTLVRLGAVPELPRTAVKLPLSGLRVAYRVGGKRPFSPQVVDSMG